MSNFSTFFGPGLRPGPITFGPENFQTQVQKKMTQLDALMMLEYNNSSQRMHRWASISCNWAYFRIDEDWHFLAIFGYFWD